MNTITKLIKKFSGIKSGRIKQKWEFNAKSGIFCEPCIRDINNDKKQEIVFGTKDGTIYVLNNEGKPLWHYKVTEKLSTAKALFKKIGTLNSIYGKPIVEDLDNDGKVEIIFGTELGYIYCLSHDGKMKWSFKTDGPIRSRVVAMNIVNDEKKEIIFGSMDKHLYVLDNNGKLVFKFEAQDAIECAPNVFKTEKNAQILFGCNDGYVYSVNYGGELKWKFKTGDRIVTQPVIQSLRKNEEPKILITSTDHCLYVINHDGALQNKFETKAQIISKPTVEDVDNDGEPEIYVGSCDDNVYALSPVLQKIWRYETNFWVGSRIIVDDIDNDGKPEVVVGSYDKKLYVFDAKPSFLIGFMPGISGVVRQNSDYGGMTRQAQHLRGKKYWQYDTQGTITGIGVIDFKKKEKNIIVVTKEGKVIAFVHENI